MVDWGNVKNPYIKVKNQKKWLPFLAFLIFGKCSSTSYRWYDCLIISRLFLRKTRLILRVVFITSFINVSSLFILTLAVPIFLSKPGLRPGLSSSSLSKLGVYVYRVFSYAIDFLMLLFLGEYLLRELLSKKSEGNLELLTLIFFLRTRLWLKAGSRNMLLF